MIDNTDVLLMIDDCFNHEAKLREFEADFLNSLSERDSFTHKQISVLQKIWERVTK